MADVIVALDFGDEAQAMHLVDRLGAGAVWYKVGLELFTRTGPSVVHALAAAGKNVFLDLKLHDIPNTVAGSVRSVAGSGARLLTVHATGGADMIAAASHAAGERLQVLAVTVLTSLSEGDTATVFGTDVRAPGEDVTRLARLAREAGADGVVCSGHEARAVRGESGPDFAIVTPGIRLAAGDVHDQARVMTPARAVAAGADYLVVGRAITRAPDPAAAFEAVRAQAEGSAVGSP